MMRKACSISILLLLGFLFYEASMQFIGDLYWRMARDRKEQSKIMECLEKCVAIDANNASFHFSLGTAYLRQGLARATNISEKKRGLRKSIHEFHEAINLEPVNSDYHFHLGISYGSLGYPPPLYWELIQNAFRRTAMLNPTNIRHLHSMGTCYLNEYRRLKNVKQNAERIGQLNYKKYAALSRGNYELYFKKLLEVNEEYLNKILDHCFSVTQAYPDLRGVIRDVSNDHSVLARFLNRKGMWEEAKKEFQLAIKMEPNNPIHYSNYAHVLSRRGDFEQAIRWWQKQKALDFRNEEPYLSSVDAFVKLKRFDDAMNELHDLRALYPENINYRVKFIRILLAARRVDEAIDEYCKMIGNGPHFSKATYDTIRHYQRKRDHQEVMRILNETLSSAPRK